MLSLKCPFVSTKALVFEEERGLPPEEDLLPLGQGAEL